MKRREMIVQALVALGATDANERVVVTAAGEVELDLADAHIIGGRCGKCRRG